MSKVRINDLARELEVKSRPILDALEAIGVSGKTHSSSIEADQAEKVRNYINSGGRSQGGASRQSGSPAVPKFDLSKAAKPGDAVRAILERKNAEAAVRSAPPAASRPVVATAPPPSVGSVTAAAARPGLASPAVSATPPAKVAVVAVPPAAPAPAATTAAASATTAPAASPSTAFRPASPAGPGAPAPRRIVPLPRQGANIVAPAPPAIASRPPSGAVIARPPAVVPAVAGRPLGDRPAIVATPPPPASQRPPVVPAPGPVPAPPAVSVAPVTTPAARGFCSRRNARTTGTSV